MRKIQHWIVGGRLRHRNNHFCQTRKLALGAVPAIIAAFSMLPSDASAQTSTSATTELPPITVIAPTPLSGTRSVRPEKPKSSATAPRGRTERSPGTSTATAAPVAGTAAPATTSPDPSFIERDKVPSNTEVITSKEFSHDYSTSFLDAISRALPGVSIGDQTGNPFQKDLNYRGFTASPVQGTPQGIAVYQNGVRINESYGDVVNWDFIPEMSISKLAMVPNNPIFGLNAIGGAMTIDMKNGFTYQGREIEAMAGAYGRRQAGAQVGYQDGNWAAYINADAINDA